MTRTHALLLVSAAVLALVPQLGVISSFWITLLDYIGIYAIIGIGLVVLTGVGGMTSFGQAMFMGVGAYATAILSTKFGISPWLTLPASLLVSGVAAWLVGVITLRLAGHYLALATIAWNVSFFFLLGSLDYFGRYDGIAGIPPLRIGTIELLDSRSIFYVIWALVGLSLLLTRNLLDSRIGRAIRSLRGGALAAEAFGVDTGGAKIVAFIYAGVLAGLAGWLYAHMQRAINPSPFSLNASIEFLLMMVVGGAGSLWGALLGAGVVTILKDQIQNVLPHILDIGGNFEAIAFGLILLVVLQKAPDGLWPHVARLLDRISAKPAQSYGTAEDLIRRPTRVIDHRLLVVNSLSKAFGGLVAVDRLSFSLKGGEIVGLIGPNGAGKSTTFNLITGVLHPTAGTIHFNGKPTVGLLSRQIAPLGVARTFQHVKLASRMSVIENVALGAHLRGSAGALRGIARMDRNEDRQLFGEAYRQLERVGLAEHCDKPAISLALGQQRIIEIARALCLDPVLLMLDEPAAGLRQFEKEALRDLLVKLRGEGITILLVEHDMDFVMGLADRLVVMNFGSKLEEGRPAEIRGSQPVIEAYLGSAA
ncbi:branched-chain amino acid ABC transporter ATP-binding protein/permease [Bradyrhizobium sp. LjRoot220]|uniref:branched-chain amino acid ABC transporter ATP-binding protein/permease n=1 Tax=Bradyrhizobium sp. LjRoot220 TaxID=3342284 RepID=UPI003ECF56E2